MATKRLSLFLGLDTSKKNVDIHEEEISIEGEGKRSRRFSQLFGITSEKDTAVDNGYEIHVHLEGEIGGKRSRRFSQLFTGAGSDDGFPLSSGEEIPIGVGREKDIATMVFKLFHVRTSSQEGAKHKRNVSTLSFKAQPRKAKTKKERVKVTVNIKPFWKQRKEGGVLKDERDTLSLTPAAARKSIKGKGHERTSSVCDSKFSSISSAISLTSLPHEFIAITAEQCTILLHLTRKVGRSLKKQERLTANFSTNLAHLFARKEKIINGNKRLSKELRKMLMAMMAGLRELVGRTFLKKAVFVQRSTQLVHDMTAMLEHGPPDVERKAKEVNDSETTLVPSPLSEGGQRISIIVEQVDALAIPLCHEQERQRQIDIHHFQHSLHILRDDISVQQQLGAALRAGVVGPCEDLRFPATVNERIATRRFVAFVDGCLSRVGKCYAQEARLVKGLEMLGGVLREEMGS
jgi:hypothetical protein